MLHYSRLQLITIVAVPVVTIVLIWTVAIFHKNRKRWRCFDTAIVAILAQSVLRNLAVVCYTVFQMVDQEQIKFDYCSVFVWFFNSIHTFQASTLSTLAVIGLFSVKLHRKRENLKNYLTVAHVVYHLFCLTTLCACVGVAAILAKRNNEFATSGFDHVPLNLCKFMPYEMDVKYNVFVTTLHVFLGVVSLASFVLVCCHVYVARSDGFDYLKKSNSDLSELSLTSVNRNDHQKATYFDNYSSKVREVHQQQWNSDTSNISTTVSSTNSRRPCLGKPETVEDRDGIGLETILPVLTVCYLFNHVPIIVLCLFPWFLSPWSVASAALCLGLLQDILVPLSLGLVDTRFCQWVSEVYRCTRRRKLNEKLPQVGLDGKFRTFACQAQPEVAHASERRASVEPKFPITNGSLYTSIDGRLPIIHNYRRHKDRNVKSTESNLVTLGVHATYLKQHEQNLSPILIPKVDYSCSTCKNETVKRETPSVEEKKKPNVTPFYDHNKSSIVNKKRISLSHYSLNEEGKSQPKCRPRRLNKINLRLSKSEDGLDHGRSDFRREMEMFAKNDDVVDSDSEDEYFTDSINANKSFDSLSLSSFSITTEANCDFDFYRMKEDLENNNRNEFVASHAHETFDYLRCKMEDEFRTPKVLQTFKPSLPDSKNFKIKRSNSKRSLESFRAFVADGDSMQRSFSYLGVNKAESQKEIEDVEERVLFKCSGSVPDLKKVFISEYL